MNRKKKIFTKLKAKDKKAKSKLASKKKDRYISKADRAKLESATTDAVESIASEAGSSMDSDK
jgi:hypothetical protein